MTNNTDGHTCSYYCERPECVRRQRDELRERMEAVLAQQPAAVQQGQAVAWFPTNGKGEIIRNYGDGSPVYASRTKDEAEQAKRCHLGATGPVIPLYTAQQPAGVDRARFRKAPCYLCGYNGEGYYQPDKHPCASLYHAAQQQGGGE